MRLGNGFYKWDVPFHIEAYVGWNYRVYDWGVFLCWGMGALCSLQTGVRRPILNKFIWHNTNSKEII
jgi:hypothetical protein